MAAPGLRAVIFARGGHGLLRLLPCIDWALLARRPLAYVGYSDLTPFLHEVVCRLRVAAFHGPMVAADFARGLSGAELESFVSVLGGEFPASLPVSCPDAGDEVVEGPLLGGCLTMLAATLGTPYACDLGGSILFLEEVGEPLYRFDRMLTHLRLSGSLANLKALVAGHLEGEGGDPELAASSEVLLDQLRREARRYPWPLAWGLPAGHDRPNLTLPLGLPARLDPIAGLLTIDPLIGAR